MTASDIAQLQSVGREAQDKRREFILRDDQKAVWDHMCALDAGRVDFVLDNCECVLIFFGGGELRTCFFLCSWV